MIKIKFKYLLFILLIFFFTNEKFIKSNASEILEYELTAIKLIFNDNKNEITAIGDAIANDAYGRVITSPKIIYNKKKKTIKTFSDSVFKDSKQNIITAENFIYDLSLKKITAINDVKYQDKDGNFYLFDQFDYFELDEKGYGKNLKATNVDKSKVKASIATIDNKSSNTILEKGGTYTTCKYNFSDSNYFFNDIKSLKECPEWEIVSKKTRHNKKEKMIYHDHPLLKIKGIPVFYSPYFSHPDPTVKRKTGFLTPSTINNDNYGRNAKIPYFFAINDYSDFTFTPIIYFEENPIFLGEFRQVGKDHSLVVDSSYTAGFSKDRENQTRGSRNHFFLNYSKIIENLKFDKSQFNFKLQRVSQKNYLKSHNILTPYVNPDIRYLNNQIDITIYDGSQYLSAAARIYENLRDTNPTTKYQYTLPDLEYSNFFNYFKNDFNLSSNLFATNYGGDSNKIQINNNLTSQSEQKIIKSLGIGNYVKTALYNIDEYNKNITNEKKNLNVENYITIASDISYPLFKSSKDFKTEQILEPRFFAKYTPGSMDPTNRSFGYGDVFSMNRANNAANPETGFSLGQGITWELTKKNKNYENFFKANHSIGQVLRLDELEEMSSTLKQKSSNIVGTASIMLDKNQFSLDDNNNLVLDKLNSNYYGLDYDYSLDNNGKQILSQSFNIRRDYKSNYFKATYSESRKSEGSSRLGTLAITKYITNEFRLTAEARKNFVSHATESNSFGAYYENDCIRIAATLNKKFYNDEDIKPTNNFYFEVVLKPFGENIAPDISPLLKID